MDTFLKRIGLKRRTLTEEMIHFAKKFKTNSHFAIIQQRDKKIGKVNIFVTEYSYRFVFYQIYDISRSLEMIEEPEECPVCYNNTHTRLKSCKHIICRDCIINIMNHSICVDHIKCPICRQAHGLQNFVIEKELQANKNER